MLSVFGWTQEQQEEVQKALDEFQRIDLLYDSGKGFSPLMFCVTEQGYICMDPRVSEIGDRLCLIYGVDVPCVLRVVEVGGGMLGKKQHNFVGESYVHGIMDGEVLGRGEDNDLVLV